MTAELPTDQAPTDNLHDVRMTVFEHLSELRRRVVYSLIAVVIGFIVAWIWAEPLFHLLQYPLKVAAPDSGLAQIHNKDLTEPFFALLKMAIVAGIFAASPVILYNLWKFVSPGLYKNEKRAAVPFVFMATMFFFMGAAFCFLVVMPYGYRFLLMFGSGVSNPDLMMKEYLSLTTKLLLAFGMIFEMPVFAMFLSMLGLITHETLLKHWRGAVVIIFIVAAILTPPDVVTQLMMATPLLILYTLSIFIAWFFTTRRRRASKSTALVKA